MPVYTRKNYSGKESHYCFICCDRLRYSVVHWSTRKFPNWPPGGKTANGTALALDAVVSLFCESI
jgi:hypothetical protein